MRGNPDDLSNQLLAKLEELLKEQAKNTEEFVDAKKYFETNDDIYIGWNECSKSLLNQIEKWKQELGL